MLQYCHAALPLAVMLLLKLVGVLVVKYHCKINGRVRGSTDCLAWYTLVYLSKVPEFSYAPIIIYFRLPGKREMM